MKKISCGILQSSYIKLTESLFQFSWLWSKNKKQKICGNPPRLPICAFLYKNHAKNFEIFCLFLSDLWQGVALLRHQRWLPSGDSICGRRDLRPLLGNRWLAHPLLSDWRAADCRSLLARSEEWNVGVAGMFCGCGQCACDFEKSGLFFKTCSRDH